MAGTKSATVGFRRITRLRPPVRMRLVGFMIVVVCGGLLLSWIAHTAWDQLQHLQKEHAAVSSESFYLGVTLRGSIRGLNGKLMQFGHAPSPAARADFFRESYELKQWLATNRAYLTRLAKLPLLKQLLIDDFDILDRINTEFENYLVKSADLLALTNSEPSRITFQERDTKVLQASSVLLGDCDDLVRAQREDFNDFLAETQSNLISHERLLKLTLALIVALAGALAILVYRGMIAPLRMSLTQSNTIIERQEKLASLGILASGVAHEIRNPLTAIKFRLFSLKKSAPTVSENEDATIIAKEINRLERIVKDFLRFGRPSEPELVTVGTEAIMNEVCEFLKGQLQRNAIGLKLEVQEPAWVCVDPQQIKQVLINLIQNAAEAIGRNGLITLRVRTDMAELEGRLRSAAILVVADSGTGIPAAVEARLFDPFFTTKEGGTGLGLAIAARIVEKHGGAWRYETELNSGTTFEILLPRAAQDGNKNTAD
jgi:signal transduction histidine kinase